MKILVFLFVILLFDGVNEVAAADKTFKITTEQFAPFIGQQLKNDGWLMDIARAALEPQGYQVVLHYRPWARAMLESKEGQHDGLYLAYYTKEREQWYVYSDPVGTVKTVFYKMKEKDIFYENLQDLKNFNIGLTRGVAISPDFDKADFLRKHSTSSDIQGLKQLLLGRIDLYVGSKLICMHLINNEINTEDRNKFEFIEPALAVHKMHMAISKKAPDYMQKLADFNRGLKQIKSDGTYEKIKQNHVLN
ncbi:transporter substrate-binding domain-containing protein [Shewanella eurypsychrophilus]|uniref:Transporter substrate-binding domain-containing protein n=2 Tax=Shewanella TaxID=22 RepID=A0ABX6V6Q6_9GAMM|nr:transporter substrate-binding domain-containing protein [Shewanella eurypsychrophilus]QPG57682.2 transporter substrate-binding domain-containing protein [Shewanella eurypsychrophilus]